MERNEEIPALVYEVRPTVRSIGHPLLILMYFSKAQVEVLGMIDIREERELRLNIKVDALVLV